jgi:hypothetical protein
MFAKDIHEGQSVTLKLAVYSSARLDLELSVGLEGTVDTLTADEAYVRFEFEWNGRDWVDFAYIPLDELADYFEEFEEDPED